ncbi:hypothetical protein U1Q18_049871 [Sarracenia purpurea var. burkii]
MSKFQYIGSTTTFVFCEPSGNWIGAFGRWVYCRFIVTCQKWGVMVAGGAPPGGRWCRYWYALRGSNLDSALVYPSGILPNAETSGHP